MLEIQANQSAELRRAIFAERLVEMFKAGGKDAAYDPMVREVVVKDAKANPTRLGFDNQGFIGSITSPLGRTWNLDNNPDGKLLGIRNPAGLHLGFDYNEEGDITRIARNDKPMLYLDYEYKGYPRSVTFPDNTHTEFRYNDQVKLAGLTTRRGVSEHYEYDTDGDLTAITDGNGNRTQFDYGLWNRPDQARYPDGGTEGYQYNPDGLLQRLISGTDTLAEIDYTEAGKPKEIRYSDGQVLRFEYNEQGKITKAQNAEITLNYSYDDQGRLLCEERDGQTASYHYDEIGALSGITYPSGETVFFKYDADQRLIAIKDWQSGSHRFHYLDNDSGVEHYHPGGVTTTIHNSPLGQPLDITVSGADYRKLFSFRYQYDNEDRVQSFSDSHLGTRAYQYDADNQLLGVTSTNTPDLREQFAYDKAGNRTQCNGQQAQFNNLNQVLKQGDKQCTYDSRGNLIEYRTHRETWRYTYDARNQLIRAKSAKGIDISFGYDAFGRRLWKRNGKREVRFFWLGENLIGETVYENDQVVSTRDYLFMPGTFTPLATRIDGEVYSYHTDHLGTPRRLTDKRGRVVWAADYRGFGEALVSVRAVENNLRFPGQYFDAETGLHYNRFRYYSPALGRYISKDLITYIGGFNLYNYVGNNITNKFDGLGLFWKTLASIAVGIAVGVAVVLTAPVSGPIALGLGLAAGGFVAGALNEGLHNGFCLTCILMEGLHGALDALGLIPGVGEIFDAVNGVIYLREGRNLEAALSFASTIPFAGWGSVAAKWTLKTPLGKATAAAVTPAIKVVADSKAIQAVGGFVDGTVKAVSDTKIVKEIQKKVAKETAEKAAKEAAQKEAAEKAAKEAAQKEAAEKAAKEAAQKEATEKAAKEVAKIPRTEKAAAEANKVIEVMSNSNNFPNKKNPAIMVYTHQDGTVSIGLSGTANKKFKAKMEILQKLLDKEAPGKYKVSTTPVENIKKVEGGNNPGQCAEPKAAQIASQNTSPITGSSVKWRGKEGGNNHQHKLGDNEMTPCDTCADPDNIKTYEDAATSNKK